MDKVLSVKIVTVDYYSCFPISNLDVTHSEFRNNEQIKAVTVLRVFGITKDKRKICCNIHQVRFNYYVFYLFMIKIFLRFFHISSYHVQSTI